MVSDWLTRESRDVTSHSGSIRAVIGGEFFVFPSIYGKLKQIPFFKKFGTFSSIFKSFNRFLKFPLIF